MTGKLTEYRRKRDFSRTGEPEGGERPRSSRLAYVIQKHDASQLHFDLRLELDGVMKSWAVPKGPSIDPSVKRGLRCTSKTIPSSTTSSRAPSPRGSTAAVR